MHAHLRRGGEGRHARKAAILALLILGGTAALPAGDLIPASAPSPNEPIRQELERQRDRLYRQRTNAAQMDRYRSSLDAELSAAIAQARGSGDRKEESLLWSYRSENEQFAGRAAYFEGDKPLAEAAYDRSFRFAKEAIALDRTPFGLMMLSDAYLNECSVKSTAYQAANVFKTIDLAQAALKADPSCTDAAFTLCARYVYPPDPFADQGKGRRMALALLDDPAFRKETYQLFDLCKVIGLSYSRQGKGAEAALWFKKALSYYPENRELADLLRQAVSR